MLDRKPPNEPANNFSPTDWLHGPTSVDLNGEPNGWKAYRCKMNYTIPGHELLTKELAYIETPNAMLTNLSASPFAPILTSNNHALIIMPDHCSLLPAFPITITAASYPKQHDSPSGLMRV
jgi:hypothetical protein